MFFGSLTSRRLWFRIASLGVRRLLYFANWVVFRQGTDVTRGTHGENIFNNKIYSGDLASITM